MARAPLNEGASGQATPCQKAAPDHWERLLGGTDTKTVEFADCDTRTVFLLGRSATVERQLDEGSSSLYATCTPSPYMLRPLYLV